MSEKWVPNIIEPNMPNFIHHDTPKLTRVDGPSGRYYATPEGNHYPSVTGIVGLGGQKYIDEWRDKVGHDVADKISKSAADRGTLIHENCERYLRGESLSFGMFQQTELRMFGHLLPILKDITEIHALETQLYSDRLKCAGTVDLICRLSDNRMVILDWKTSGRFKESKDIEHYFCQCSAYAYMFYERTGIAIGSIIIAMTTEEFGLLKFEEGTKKWLPRFIQMRKEFENQTGK